MSHPVERFGVLLGACALLWAVESRWPLFAFGSARARHLLPNLVLASMTILMNLGFTSALRAARPDFGFGGGPWPLWLQGVAGVAVLDFFTWLSHFLLHKMAWGWRVHRVHHSDVAVDVTTAFRQHPGETVWRIAWRVLPVTALGLPIPVVALYELLSATNGLLEHANIAVPARADGLMRWLFVTPNMHKWHHSRDARETDTNYGNIFSVWDRLFGTLTGRAQLARLRYGLDGFDGSDSQSLGGLLRMPIGKED
jgi:sterol desaturase/sphingolipid hydroxylase (fatty acid hydroxylase superfamily)